VYDCSPILPGGINHFPDTLPSHANWAIDAWFQSHKNSNDNCNFAGSAEVVCATCTCVFNDNATDDIMQDSINIVCGVLNCAPIHPGGAHYEPNTVKDHATWAIDAWYQTFSWTFESCDFEGHAHLSPEICNGRPVPKKAHKL